MQWLTFPGWRERLEFASVFWWPSDSKDSQTCSGYPQRFCFVGPDPTWSTPKRPVKPKLKLVQHVLYVTHYLVLQPQSWINSTTTLLLVKPNANKKRYVHINTLSCHLHSQSVVWYVTQRMSAADSAFLWQYTLVGGALVQRVRRLFLRSTGCKFKSCSRWHCVTALGKLFTPMCLCYQAV